MSKSKNRTRASSGMGSIRKRPDGRWEARYSTPSKGQQSVYGKTEKEVAAKLRTKLHELDTGIWQAPSKMTVSEWFDIWLTDYQGHNTPRTVLKNRCIVYNHFVPLLGHYKLTKLLPIHINHVVTALQEADLTPATIKSYMRILSASMQHAVEGGIIMKNPVKGTKLPRVEPSTFCIIDRADIHSFIDAAKETDYPNELIFMLFTGMRIGELRGLKWSDCDLDARTVHVQRQLHPMLHDLKRYTPPKYGEDRTIHIPDEAVAILKDQRRRQAEQRIASGEWIDDEITTDLVFRTKNGKAHNEKTIYRAVKAVGKAIDKPELHPHDLRHSYAIAALRAGADVKTVQYNLGHKTAQMTLNVYAAYTDDAGKVGANKLSIYLKNTPKNVHN